MRQSIESVIYQTYKNWELIIIDDCSTDSTPAIAKEYAAKDNRIRYYRNETNLKLPRGLNRGFSLSKGEYLTWTSDDNLFNPNALAVMVDTIIEKEADFVFASCDVIDENGKVFQTMGIDPNYKQSIIGGNCVGACFMYTRTIYETVGEYNPEMFLVEDYDYWLRIFAEFDVFGITQVLYKYRMHAESLTNTKKELISAACEKMLLSNISRFGKLSLRQKYYLYYHLNRLCSDRKSKDERNKYRKKYRKYRVLFLVFINPRDRIRMKL